ncbi:MAG: Asp-tRNA(Asn)/Glu-tRNA(Gln) amidotransferase subunit GatB [Candidatus Micrarchaeota archaeon]|nr:Asp-tRNA(Asn)/Glu-tRNA(Gln) amidotransferase subunit GatB [Candidatus Micrarchaeota archaeon]
MRIGLEVHVALPTKSKLFCGCRNFADEPNTAICPICMGLPGSKPVLNSAAVMYALSIANALHCKANDTFSFVRKVYFYPDLPKSYQITQLNEPIGDSGYVELSSGKIGIRRLQLEEDPARIVRGDGYSLLDFNRSGTPLVEIVTEPDITSEEALREFLFELRSILYYLGIDIDKEMKADLNISMADQRVEVKNITGIKNLIDAARYEIGRQSKLIARGEPIAAETRAYIEDKGKTESAREKESDEEYGYIFDPDLARYPTGGIRTIKPVYTTQIAADYAAEYNANAKTIKELIAFRKRALEMMDYGKSKYDMKTVINAISLIIKYGKEGFSNGQFDQVVDVINSGAHIEPEMFDDIEKGKKPEIKVNIVSDEELEDFIRKTIASNTQVLEDYKKNKKALNFIINLVVEKYALQPKVVAEKLSKIVKEYGV